MCHLDRPNEQTDKQTDRQTKVILVKLIRTVRQTYRKNDDLDWESDKRHN